MRNGFLCSLSALLAGAGLAMAQPADMPATTTPPPTAPAAAAPMTASTDGGAAAGAGQQAAEQRAAPPNRLYASAEFLTWITRDLSLPPLATAGPAGSTGALGTPGTRVVLGGGDLDSDWQTGGRFTLGSWIGENRTFALEGIYFMLDRASPHDLAASGASTILARPFLNVLTNREDAALVAAPGLASGRVELFNSTRLHGAEANARALLVERETLRLEALGGFRFLDLNDDLQIFQFTQILPGVPFAGGSQTFATDHFNSRNRFYGGQVGFEAEVRRGRAFVNLLGKVAFGENRHEVTINGQSTLRTPANIVTVLPSSPLTLPTNSGVRNAEDFSVVPELGIRVGFQVTCAIRAYVGYTFLYASSVSRPGDQIDRSLNLTQVPSPLGPSPLVGSARPVVSFRDTDFWAQGFSAGLEFRY